MCGKQNFIILPVKFIIPCCCLILYILHWYTRQQLNVWFELHFWVASKSFKSPLKWFFFRTFYCWQLEDFVLHLKENEGKYQGPGRCLLFKNLDSWYEFDTGALHTKTSNKICCADPLIPSDSSLMFYNDDYQVWFTCSQLTFLKLSPKIEVRSIRFNIV